MIASQIGKIFLEAYNEKYETDYDARGFFIEVFYPLFFNQRKYMMTAGNSPLENPKLSWEDMILGKKPFETTEQRRDRYDKLISKIDETEADASIARGYYSLDVNATTSGQVTDLQLPISKDDVFASWIGDALGVGVQGGLSIMFNDKRILLDIYDGWKLYRDVLNNTSKLKGNQINTWNGQWLSHYYDDRDYTPESPMAGFNPYITGTSGLMSIDTTPWTKILIGMARKYASMQILGYVYSIGQTNTTIGFIPFNLDRIRKPSMLYKKYFGMENGRNAEKLWGTRRLCADFRQDAKRKQISSAQCQQVFEPEAEQYTDDSICVYRPDNRSVGIVQRLDFPEIIEQEEDLQTESFLGFHVHTDDIFGAAAHRDDSGTYDKINADSPGKLILGSGIVL